MQRSFGEYRWGACLFSLDHWTRRKIIRTYCGWITLRTQGDRRYGPDVAGHFCRNIFSSFSVNDSELRRTADLVDVGQQLTAASRLVRRRRLTDVLGGRTGVSGVEGGRQSLARLDGVPQPASQRVRIVVARLVATSPPVGVGASTNVDHHGHRRLRSWRLTEKGTWNSWLVWDCVVRLTTNNLKKQTHLAPHSFITRTRFAVNHLIIIIIIITAPHWYLGHEASPWHGT